MPPSTARSPGGTPTTAFVVTLFGDFSLLLLALVLLPAVLSGGSGASSAPYVAMLFLSAVGAFVAAVLTMVRPEQHIIWGGLVLLFSLVALPFDGGVFAWFPPVVVPPILVLVGGILTIVWKPSEPVVQAPRPPMAP